MNIAILGATGKFGKRLTSKLLENEDYKLTLISKSAGDVFDENEQITAKNIDASNLEDLKEALENQDLVYCAISGSDLPSIAENLVEINPKRLILMGAVGIYNELAEGNGSEYNVDNEPPQIPNTKAVKILEDSELDYTIFRPGFLRDGDEDDYVITHKGETPKGYYTTFQSVLKIALEIIENPELYFRESISITRDMT